MTALPDGFIAPGTAPVENAVLTEDAGRTGQIEDAGPTEDSTVGPLASGPLRAVPGARLLWRDAGAVQWESAGRAVILDGADSTSIGALLGGPGAADRQLVGVRRTLHAMGYLWHPGPIVTGARHPAPHDAGVAEPTATPPRPLPIPERLLPDLEALAVRRGDDAADVMAARRSRSVRVIGADRLAPAIAALLGAAGVGQVEVPVDADVRLWQAMPGGLRVADEGQRWRDAVATSIYSAAPDAHTGSRPGEPDLVVLTGSRPVDDAVRQQLHDQATAHLCVGVDAVRAIVGPLVVPGFTSCLRCADLHRRDRDPAWWALAAQLSTARPRSEPSDVALCAAAAGIAALQALAFLDGEKAAVIDGTLEMALPDWRLRRRSWRRHEACDCRGESS